MTSREKPHLLFITEKWCDCNPNMGLTNSEHNLFGSLEASDLATYERFHYDEFYLSHNRTCDSALIQKCLKSKPDLIILSWFAGGPPGSTWNPKLETLEILRIHLQIPIIAIWFDTASPRIMGLAEQILPVVDLNIVLDSSTTYLASSQPEKYLSLWTPQDRRIFFDPNLERDIEVSFVGSLLKYSDRILGVNTLKSHGINICQTGGQRECKLLVNEYARIHMRSKIGLNFSRSIEGFFQAKGRIFEITLCGAMLLEAENPETAKWFTPMVDYVPFVNEIDLLDKVQYFLDHPFERLKIARHGRIKANERYTEENFWKEILEKFQLALYESDEQRQDRFFRNVSDLVIESIDLKNEILFLRNYLAQLEKKSNATFEQSPDIEINLDFRDTNFIIFPDWSQVNENLFLDLKEVIKFIITHSKKENMALFITTNISDEEANLILCNVMINLLMNEAIDVADDAGIYLLGSVDSLPWKSLINKLQYKILLKREDTQTVIRVGADKLACLRLETLITNSFY